MPKTTVKNVGKMTKTPRRIFNKRIILDITGTSKEAVNKVARAVHSISTEETTGGCTSRKVQLTHESTDIRQIFYGNI